MLIKQDFISFYYNIPVFTGANVKVSYVILLLMVILAA